MPKIEDLNKPPPLPDTTNVQKIVIDVKARADEDLTIRFKSFTCFMVDFCQYINRISS